MKQKSSEKLKQLRESTELGAGDLRFANTFSSDNLLAIKYFLLLAKIISAILVKFTSWLFSLSVITELKYIYDYGHQIFCDY